MPRQCCGTGYSQTQVRAVVQIAAGKVACVQHVPQSRGNANHAWPQSSYCAAVFEATVP
jgi:hypothetical protein